jgi:spore germination protein KC
MKRYLLIFFALASILLLSGCWNYREVNRLAIVGGVAIDKEESSNEYKLTIEIMQPEAGETGGGKIKSEVFETKGATIFEAIRDFVLKIGRRPYWAHAKVLIINKAIAEEEISPVLDFFYRDSELRRDIFVLVSKEDTAGEILRTDPDLDDTRSFHIFSVIQGQKSTYKYPKTELWEVVENLSHKERALLIPAVQIGEGERKIAEVRGSAILKADKVICYIDDEDTRNVLWINGELNKGLFAVKNIEDGNDITFEVFGSKNKSAAAYDGETVKINTSIKAEVNIAELSGSLNFRDKEIRQRLEDEGAEALKKSLKSTVSKLQHDFKSDVFKFYSAVEIEDPKLWKNLKPKWEEEFSSSSIELDVKLHIRGSATASKPIKGE